MSISIVHGGMTTELNWSHKIFSQRQNFINAQWFTTSHTNQTICLAQIFVAKVGENRFVNCPKIATKKLWLCEDWCVYSCHRSEKLEHPYPQVLFHGFILFICSFLKKGGVTCNVCRSWWRDQTTSEATSILSCQWITEKGLAAVSLYTTKRRWLWGPSFKSAL